MADDQVKYSDLISDDVAKGIAMLDEALKGLRDTMASLKDTAVNIGESIKGMGTVTKEQQQVTAKEAAEIEALNKKVKDLTDKIKKLEDVKLHYRKLTDDQITSLKAFQAALQGSSKQVLDAVNAIEIEKKSYNELNAIYNTLKDSLNAMTIAERQNSEAGKAMTAQAAKIYDTMNELQKATGKYTLQVGKYRAAFDGLGYSFQQILREAPSALNLNQFFLAISNNIPMFLDQLKAFKNEQAEIKANLANMTEGTKEYAEQQAKQMTVGKKLVDSILSWQTAILVGLMLLRNYGSEVISWIGSLFSKTKNADDAMKQFDMTMRDINRNASDAVKNASVELGILMDRLDGVKSGTDEWKNLVERVNEITGETLDYQKAMPDEIREVTKAYLEQALTIEKNKQIIETLAKSQMGRRLVNQSIADKKILNNEKYSPEDIVRMMGLDPKEQDELIEGIEFYRRFNNSPEFYAELVKRAMDATGVMQKEAEDMLRGQYENVGGTRRKQPIKTPTAKESSEQSMADQYWKAEEELLKRQYEGYQLELKLAKLHRDQARDEQNEWYVDQRLALEENLKNGIIKQDEYDIRLQELNRENKAIRKGIDEKYYADLRALRSKNLKERRKEWKANSDAIEKDEKENAKTRLKAAVDGWAEYKAKLVEEGKTRKQIVEAEVAAEIARLNLMLKLNRDINGEKMSDEQRQKVEEWINLLEKLQQTGNYGDYKPGQFMGKGGANVTNERKNYANIWEVLGIDMDNNQVSALNSVFDQAKEALNSWMDARKAAADQAKELADDEVSAAENALNREIELRNQGYANDVALREKELADAKAAQKKAAEEQKKVAQEQVLLDAALQTSSMITASANIIKQFPNPLAWAPMLALMWGTFAYAKTKAYQASTKSIKFKEGGVMLLEGGSHESGHDVNLGIGPDGSNLRAEGGEYFAVINKRSSRKYGSQIPAVVNALNSGMFEDRYIKTSDAVGLLPQVIRADNGTAVDLSSLEGGVDALVKQGESRWSTEGEYRVMRYKNLTRRVRIGG